jgi:hypothetical protein
VHGHLPGVRPRDDAWSDATTHAVTELLSQETCGGTHSSRHRTDQACWLGPDRHYAEHVADGRRPDTSVDLNRT